MSALSEVVDVTITDETSTVSEEGFGTPIILSANATFPERVRSYSDTAGMVTDGFTSTTPEYLAAEAMFSQSPRPELVKVGRRANKPTLRWAITPTAANLFNYQMKFAGNALTSFTSDSDGTVTEVITGLKALIDALALPVTVSNQTTYMRILENVAGAWHQASVLGVPGVENLAIEMDHADPGLAADLAAIALEDNDWYAICNLYNSAAEVAAIAAYAEANGKLFVAASQQSSILGGGSSDIASTLETSAYTKTAVLHHPDNSEFVDAALLGRCLPTTPGSETWMFKNLAGVAAATYTSTQKTNMRAKNCGWYTAFGGTNVTFEGKVASGSYIDVERGKDWTEARMAEGVVNLLIQNDKIGFTDKGVANICAVLREVQDTGVTNGLYSDDPAPLVTAPLVADVSDSDKSNRILPDVVASQTIAGAIHKVRVNVRIVL